MCLVHIENISENVKQLIQRNTMNHMKKGWLDRTRK